MRIVADDGIPYIDRVLDQGHELILLDHNEITTERLKHTEILIVRSVTRVDEALLDGTEVKVVATPTSGTDHIDQTYLASAGIHFISTPGCNARSVAEYVLSSLYLLKKQSLISLTDITVGIIGCGHVGTSVASMLAAVGIKYKLYDPPLQAAGDEREFVSLSEIQSADLITLHVPLHMGGAYPTYHLVDNDFLSALTPDTIIINTARGGVIDESALLEYFTHDKLKSVVLDVWENEPQINRSLLSKAIISTPHIAGYSLDAKFEGSRQVAEKISNFKQMEYSDPGKETILPMTNSVVTVTDVMDDDEVIQFAVLSGYDVSDDSDRFKQVSYVHGSEQEKISVQHFSGFRKNYPVRREFTNFSVILPPSRKKCKQKLEGLGFKVKLQE